MAKILHFKKRDVELKDAPRAFVRACPKCRRRKYVTAHFEGNMVLLICGHCYVMGRIPRSKFSPSGRTLRA